MYIPIMCVFKNDTTNMHEIIYCDDGSTPDKINELLSSGSEILYQNDVPGYFNHNIMAKYNTLLNKNGIVNTDMSVPISTTITSIGIDESDFEDIILYKISIFIDIDHIVSAILPDEEWLYSVIDEVMLLDADPEMMESYRTSLGKIKIENTIVSKYKIVSYTKAELVSKHNISPSIYEDIQKLVCRECLSSSESSVYVGEIDQSVFQIYDDDNKTEKVMGSPAGGIIEESYSNPCKYGRNTLESIRTMNTSCDYEINLISNILYSISTNHINGWFPDISDKVLDRDNTITVSNILTYYKPCILNIVPCIVPKHEVDALIGAVTGDIEDGDDARWFPYETEVLELEPHLSRLRGQQNKTTEDYNEDSYSEI